MIIRKSIRSSCGSFLVPRSRVDRDLCESKTRCFILVGTFLLRFIIHNNGEN